MKKLFLTAFISLSLVAALAQDKIIYDANAEVRKVPGFNTIKVSHGY